MFVLSARVAWLPLLLAGCWTDVVVLGAERCGDGGCRCADGDDDGVCDDADACTGDDLLDTDGDGVCDANDRCAGDDHADADLDGVCDASDLCPSADDRLDIDGDGIRDCVDRCRYDGPTPPPLWSLPSDDAFGLIVTSLQFSDGSRVSRLGAGDTTTVRVGFTAEDCECPTCVWSVRIGLVGEAQPQQCIWLGVPGCPGVSQVVTATVRAPAMPGEYGLALDRVRDTQCSMRTWDGGTVRAEEIAVICAQ